MFEYHYKKKYQKGNLQQIMLFSEQTFLIGLISNWFQRFLVDVQYEVSSNPGIKDEKPQRLTTRKYQKTKQKQNWIII